MAGKKSKGGPSTRADFLSEEEFFSTAYLAGQGVIFDEIVAEYDAKLVESQLRAQRNADKRTAQVEASGERRAELVRAKEFASMEADDRHSYLYSQEKLLQKRLEEGGVEFLERQLATAARVSREEDEVLEQRELRQQWLDALAKRREAEEAIWTAHLADRKADADADRATKEVLRERRLREKADANATRLAAHKHHRDTVREETLRYREGQRAAEEERRRQRQEIEAEKIEQAERERMEKRRKMERDRAFRRKFHGRKVQFNW